ncbi:MAG: VOC family protein [Hyphomicrobium aestuarii]|nr:VOC family protein [Hyphomicrobium aestuarii]
MTATVAHMMLRVRDEATSVAFYRAAFGLEIAERADFDTFALIYMRNANSPFEVELTVNKDRTEPYNLGDGYGHIAFVVDDIAAEHARMTAAGLTPRDIKSMALSGKPFARFFFIDDPDGYKIEVIERGGRFA